jgi:hypothetical protein
MEQAILSDYTARATAADHAATKYDKLANTYSLLRLGIFAAMIFAIYLGIVNSNMTIIAVAFVVLIFCFAWLVSRQSYFDQLKHYYNDLKAVCDNEMQSMASGANIYDNGSTFAADKHYYTADLDIFGNASLFQLLNRAATPQGSKKLAAWLSDPADKGVVLERQDAIKDTGTNNDWKLDFQARLLFARQENHDQLQQALKFLKIPVQVQGEKWLGLYALVAPFLMLSAIIFAVVYPGYTGVAVLLGLVNLGLVFSKAAAIRKADLLAGKIGDILNRYAIVFETIEKAAWQAKWCVEAADQLKKEQTSIKIKELARLINKLNYHLNLIIGVVLNVFFLWDIRQVIAIENWKRQNHQQFEQAFDVIAGFEALISLGSLHINYPAWAFPQIDDRHAYTLMAENIAHPLISSKTRVENNYSLNQTFEIDIITGSNMAGKSTFLRTIGINTVLALSGAPVCAKNMTVSVMQVVSYMRIKDSLNESTSTFKAELDRLQMLLSAVENKGKVFFLIDEMLRGTNSVDKYRGSKAVIEHLISKNGVGMVATHDLQIAELEKKYPFYIRNYYFDIQVINGEMLFDYKIKDGECKTFNASLLLKQIGIQVEDEF